MATKKEKMTKGRECVCLHQNTNSTQQNGRKLRTSFGAFVCLSAGLYNNVEKNGQKIETAAAGVLSSRRQLPPYCDLFSKDEFGSWQTK